MIRLLNLAKNEMRIASAKAGLLLAIASTIVLFTLLAACTPSQDPLPVQPGTSLLSVEATETAAEPAVEATELIETDGTKEAVSVDDFIVSAEELSFEELALADMKHLGGPSPEEVQIAEALNLVRMAGFGYRGVVEVLFFDFNIPGEAEADFANVREFATHPTLEAGLRSNVRGQNYDSLFLEFEETFYFTARVDNTMVMAQGVPEGIDAIHALLEAIGYQ